MENKPTTYTLVRETTGSWFWKKEFAIYRHYSYVLGNELVMGKGLIGRYRTIAKAVDAFKVIRADRREYILTLEV